MKKELILGIAVMQSILGMQAVCTAATTTEENIPVYSMDTVVVTANRYEKPDVETAASTTVVTAQKIKDSGATNAQQALSKVSGMISDSSRAGGGAINPFSASEVEIRGTSGTLVLVNGMPLNLNNRYQLNDIPADNIERIEVVKGGGSVLYGSEAIGGVTNIITKNSRQNDVKVGFGNRGHQKHGVDVQAAKLGLSYNYEKWGSIDHVSDYKGKYNDAGVSENNSFDSTYKFDDKWTLNLSHNNGRFLTTYMGPDSKTKKDSPYAFRKYNTREDYLQLIYDNHVVSGNLYYNYADIGYNSTVYRNQSTGALSKKPVSSYVKEKDSVIGGELQKVWNTKKAGKFLFGGDFKHESFNPDSNEDASDDYTRNIFSIFGSWDKNLSAENDLILSTRGTWTGSSPHQDNYYNLSSQVQFLHKLDASQSLYASVGQSFKMPTFKQIYGSVGSGIVVDANPNVKPQTGIHYELGWKKTAGAHNWKAALFNEYISDNISAVTTGSSNYQFTNEDLRNTGIEISCDVNKGEGFNFNYGLTYQNPMVQSTSKTGILSDWRHKYGKVQLTGGVGYVKDKWRASLTANYLADRYMLSSTSHEETKPYLLTALNVAYAPTKHQEFSLTVDNLLDREDNLGHTGTYYYTTPINFLLSYKYTF